MHKAATSSSRQRSRWKALLWPLLLAEVGFTLVCLGAGALIWQASDRRESENALARLQASHSVYARQLDARLTSQQQHLLMLARGSRRILQSMAENASTLSEASPGLPAVLSHDDTQRLLTRLLDDYYGMDALVTRLFILPVGMRAFSVPEGQDDIDSDLPPYQRARTSTDAEKVTWWSGAQTPPERLVATHDVVWNERYLARVGMAISQPRLKRLLHDETGNTGEHWLVDDAGHALMRDDAPRVLPDAAGRYGMQWLEEGRRALIWDTLPGTGWRLVSRLSLPDDSAWQTALPWLSIGLILGNVLIFAGFVTVLYWRLQREQDAWQAALGRLAGWLPRTQDDVPDVSDVSPATLNALLTRLEPPLGGRAPNQAWDLPAWLNMLQLPALLTHGDAIVTLNAILARLLGERPEARRDVLLAEWLNPRLIDDERRRVRLTDAAGGAREYRLECLAVQGEYSVWALIDQTQVSETLHRERLARDQAREDARLKTGYLAHLRQELDACVQRLRMPSDAGTPHPPPQWEALRQRLEDVMLLLDTLSEGKPASDAHQGDASPWVLVVDDGPVNTLLACGVLERQGYHVETATNGEEALALAEHRAFALVFMDIYMPSLDGLETSRRWRRLERRLARRHTSVLVALTANVTDADQEAFLQAGMDDYLAKPYRPSDLVAVVHRWIGAGVRPKQ
ncbi:CheY-like chemotaxis protein [Chromohalobacter marismortui]|uniref:CheY-like chemotaxis protein n=1 Tax=Chromohalobacter marismortui TaxID=42055 RepID=A0A4R7NIM6_9GAMM|nr:MULTISPECIES: response regulator [Chromohalobacter]MCI0511542.1 response regulator [Chromohalobacter sp.]MCI0594467.1 response regulator [Chromohalobacter sp.]TDU20483.1 CheY-like chemotaxis protein [Chromohalobacter marismortui]